MWDNHGNQVEIMSMAASVILPNRLQNKNYRKASTCIEMEYQGADIRQIIRKKVIRKAWSITTVVKINYSTHTMWAVMPMIPYSNQPLLLFHQISKTTPAEPLNFLKNKSSHDCIATLH